MDKKHIVWSDMNLDLNDWRDDLIEQYPDASEDTLISKMYEINNDYLDDTRANLNIQLSQSIVIIGELKPEHYPEWLKEKIKENPSLLKVKKHKEVER